MSLCLFLPLLPVSGFFNDFTAGHQRVHRRVSAYHHPHTAKPSIPPRRNDTHNNPNREFNRGLTGQRAGENITALLTRQAQ